MFIIGGTLTWSATDLTLAAECEYALLRALDYKLGRAEMGLAPVDPLLKHIGALGDRHEARLLESMKAAGDVIVLEHVDGYTPSNVRAARAAAIAAFAAQPDVIAQAAFFDGEFFGYADFIERTDDGWTVCDAKLARHAKPQALLQLGAYAEQLHKLDLPVSQSVALLLGNGRRVEFRLDDVLPVFRERRARLLSLISDHRQSESPVAWGAGGIVACGRCPECQAAAESSDDVLLVAGLRMDQRRRLRASGIATVSDLASCGTPPDGLVPSTFRKLRAQAALQAAQRQAGPGAPLAYELTDTAAETLRRLPAASVGDLFFDFEGDPLFDEGDPTRIGLEYLWGVMRADETYAPMWAHDSAQERTAFVAFIDSVTALRAEHPDLHIYHYAAYETSALKRLAMRYQTREKELDDLLRSEVFVDLYATIRGAIRVGSSSYSIKKLEPLYMAAEMRDDSDDAVGDGGASVVAYHRYRAKRTEDPVAAEAMLVPLADYNEYDCLSTLRLRDWLLDRAKDAGVLQDIKPQAKVVEGEELSDQEPLFVALMAKAGEVARLDRTPDQQTYAMLATSLDYFRREKKSFWWEHFERLAHPVEDWGDTRDIFIVESAEVVADWEVPDGQAIKARRTVRLVGDWTAGSKPSDNAQVVYAAPTPDECLAPERAPYGCASLLSLVTDPADPRAVTLVESRKPDETHAALPIALVPGMPPGTANLEAAIEAVAAHAADAPSLPASAVLDLLSLRPPRLRNGRALPRGSSPEHDVVSALLGMEDSYVAIQGPPGTGKTYIGSRVIKTLVERHGWRIGVVGPSHAVVENMLGAIVENGLDESLVGKAKTESRNPTWTKLSNVGKFLNDRADSGTVIGGTAWDFANPKTVPPGALDLLVIDEAGQFSLAPTIAASVAASRLLLLGDPQQLPQVSQAQHAEPVDRSALSWVMQDHTTIPEDRGYFLERSFRMHPALCGKVSALSYARRLSSAPQAAERSLAGDAPGLEVVEVEHIGNRTVSAEEAAAVVEEVEAHLGREWTEGSGASPRPLTDADILVVAPYNAQVSCIKQALAAAGHGGVRVGTVDRFQGQEAPIAIVSMTASSHGDVPRGMGFLLSRNRVNVAVSRAQWKAIVVRSPLLTAYMPSSAESLLELGAFIGLCGAARRDLGAHDPEVGASLGQRAQECAP